MALGRCEPQQKKLWVSATELPRSAGHPFYDRLNRILEEAGFDRFVEEECARFYAERMGRPGLAPGRYFRLLLLGFFEGEDSERGIAWRVSDSLSLRQFLKLDLVQRTPDHSTISGTRRRIDLETHAAVFSWVLARMSKAGLLQGRTLGVDATTLEANAAMRSIVRRDTKEGYAEFLRKLASASGIESPSRAELRRFDRKRKKKTSNGEWEHPQDPDARVAKMKDGRTRMAHKAEHAVDLDSGALVAVTVQPADRGDTATLGATLEVAAAELDRSGEQVGKREVVADRGYHGNATMTGLAASGVRSYVSEPERGRRRWRGAREARAAVYGNRRRIRGSRGMRLSRLRSELVERAFAHCYETGGMRRVHLRGHNNISKRLLVHAAGFNLSVLMRKVSGVGKPRVLQGRLCILISFLDAFFGARWPLCGRSGVVVTRIRRARAARSCRLPARPISRHLPVARQESSFSTGC